MREILFKAKRVDNGEWVEGNLVKDVDGEQCIVRNYGIESYSWDQVIPETVSQYTGVEDNDGKKIFEMDILKHTFTKWEDCEEIRYSKNYFVKWYSSMTNCGYRYKNKRNIFPFKEGTVWSGKDIVIGNMHDNPELLESDV